MKRGTMQKNSHLFVILSIASNIENSPNPFHFEQSQYPTMTKQVQVLLRRLEYISYDLKVLSFIA